MYVGCRDHTWMTVSFLCDFGTIYKMAALASPVPCFYLKTCVICLCQCDGNKDGLNTYCVGPTDAGS